MAYNKAREEKKWRLWKEAEEKQLRSLGVSEKDIVTYIDAQGTIFVDWDCGSSLGLIYGDDLFRIVE